MKKKVINNDYSGRILGPLKDLKPLLLNWQSFMSVEFWPDKNDALWWYNERALLSLFAGAAWRCKGGWALEEFATQKWKATHGGKHKNHLGRGDIMFGLSNKNFIAEAKQCWPIIGKGNPNAMRVINQSLRRARSESSRLPNYGYKLGIVFAVPRVKSKEQKVEKISEGFIRQLRELKNITLTWVFPKERRRLSAKDGYLYPGVVLLLRPLRIKNTK